MKAWGMTDKGLKRHDNQDSFYIYLVSEEDQLVCVVCDGMGGANGGHVASATAVNAFLDELRNYLKPQMSKLYMKNIISMSVKESNRLTYLKSLENPAYSGMGTTLVGLIVSGGVAVVVNIGDSRAYHIGSGEIRQITTDHSLVEEMLSRGELTIEEAQYYPGRNLITRVIGTDYEVEADIFDLSPGPGDYILLCSDGLSNMVDDKSLVDILSAGDEPNVACEKLVALANERGGHDNITVALVQF